MPGFRVKVTKRFVSLSLRAACDSEPHHMSTPFSRYLQSNQAPSEDETHEIKALRANPLKEISIIDVEIEQIEATLNSLKRKRAHIQESIDDFNTILAPVRRIPMDILGVIFVNCLATHRNPIMSASEAPILLTHICRDWRSIALSIPRLWSRLYVPTLPIVLQYPPEAPPSVNSLKAERRLKVRTEEVQRWLRLSAACPLAITLMPAGGPASHPPLLDSIIQSSRRWQQLELGLGFFSPESDVVAKLLSLSPDDLCMLRELRIYSLYSTVNPYLHEVKENPWYQSGLLTAQGLRSISIADMRNSFPASIPPNWKNLNQLFISSPISFRLARSMVNYCCNLVACLFEITERDYDAIPDASITLSSHLPYLNFLSLQGDSNGCSQLFRCIEAPSLQILDYHGLFFLNGTEEFGLLNLLQNINSLETLRVDHRRVTESIALKYYPLIPSVTRLVFGRSRKRSHPYLYEYPNPGYATFITALHEIKHQHSHDSAPTVLFPSLETFEAYDISFAVTDIMLLEFIKARIDATKSNAGVSKLKKVLVEFSGRMQTDIVPEALAYAQAAGIKLELDVKYYGIRENLLDETWSPSFGLSRDDVSWVYPLYD
jgi:hypothetical protein